MNIWGQLADATLWHHLQLHRVTQASPTGHPLLRRRWRPLPHTYIACIRTGISEKSLSWQAVFECVCAAGQESSQQTNASHCVTCSVSFHTPSFASQPVVTGTFQSEKCKAGLVPRQVIDRQPVIMQSIFIFYLLLKYKDSASVPGNECSLSLCLAWIWKCV